MKVIYAGNRYFSIKEAFDQFMIDINSDDTEFMTKKEAYKFFKEKVMKKIKNKMQKR